jgi:hypothetical protein
MEFQFACQSCHEPFQFFLPVETTRATLEKCTVEDVKEHNLPISCKCQNCGFLNTIYYCKSGHQDQMTQ